MIEDFFHLHLELRISPRIFEKIRNGHNGILRGSGETDSWKKPEVENLVTLSLQHYIVTDSTTLQRKNSEILKQIFPEKEYQGLSPNFHIHTYVSDLYIPMMGLPILLEEIGRLILRLYINHSQTHKCWNWGWDHAIPRKGIHKWDFRCSVCTST